MKDGQASSSIVVAVILLFAFLVGSCTPEVMTPPTPIQYSAGNGATDIDGNSYPSVIYGNGQEWLAENLRTTHFANGDPILDVPNSVDWSELSSTQPAQSSYQGDNQYDIPYGRYYNWSAITDNRNVCPDGWHSPTVADWQSLFDYLGGAEVSGHPMRLIGTQFWSAPNNDATNVSGFSAVGTGKRLGVDGGFFNLGGFANWWSTQAQGAGLSVQPWNSGTIGVSVILAQRPDVEFDVSSRKTGMTARCIKGMGPLPSFGVNQFNSASGDLNVEILNYDIAPILDGGICWSTSPNPTIGNSQSQNGMIGGDGITSEVFGAPNPAPTSGLTYYVRAYATNTFGTSYGTEESFIAP